MPQVAYYLLVAFSAFSLGAAGFTGILEGMMTKDWDKPHPWRGVMKFGYMIVIGTILWLVLPRRVIEPSPALYVYLVGLTLAGIGAVGAAMTTIKTYVRFLDDEEENIHKEIE